MQKYWRCYSHLFSHALPVLGTIWGQITQFQLRLIYYVLSQEAYESTHGNVCQFMFTKVLDASSETEISLYWCNLKWRGFTAQTQIWVSLGQEQLVVNGLSSYSTFSCSSASLTWWLTKDHFQCFSRWDTTCAWMNILTRLLIKMYQDSQFFFELAQISTRWSWKVSKQYLVAFFIVFPKNTLFFSPGYSKVMLSL